MFKQYRPIEYIAIEIANQFGLDKYTFEYRIQWVKDNINNLELLQDNAEEPYLYYKAVREFRKVQQGKPTNLTIALDSVNSGFQIMSALTNDRQGAILTGLINHNFGDKRADSYSYITEYINKLLDNDELTIPRKDAKRACMTWGYGSVKVPKEVFGNLIHIFEQAMKDNFKGAVQLREILFDTHDKDALSYKWLLPDGHQAYCPVMVSQEKRVSINELNYTPVIAMTLNEPDKHNISNIANVIHSIDAYVLRCMVRRCNYNPHVLHKFLDLVKHYEYIPLDNSYWFIDRYKATGLADISFINYIDKDNIHEIPIDLIKDLQYICGMCLTHEPFEIIPIHDSYACHANHCNQLRYHYKEILAELSESNVITDILSQLFNEEITYIPDEYISDDIRLGNYAIC